MAGPAGLHYLGAERDGYGLAEVVAESASTDFAALGHLDQVAEELSNYGAGQLREFSVPIDYGSAGVPPGFARDVYEAIREVPMGCTAAYGEIAADVGRPGAARAVGRLCRDVPWVFLVPVHRIRRADGSFGDEGNARRDLVAWETWLVSREDRE